jgi:hypothetical protein
VVTGAVSYNVYGSPSTSTKNLLTTTPITATTFSYSQVPYVPRDILWNFWVSSLTSTGSETFLSLDPASFQNQLKPFKGVDSVTSPIPGVPICQQVTSAQTTLFGQSMVYEPAMEFYVNEIRRRHQVMLENDGEDYDVYLRRWEGAACPHEDDRRVDDPDYNTLNKCPLCFGTGILGGFYHKLTIKLRYNDIPQHKISFMGQGLVYSHDFDSWALWTPIFREHDLIVNRVGDRFIFENTARSTWRGVVLQQKMRLLALQTGDVRYTVTDTLIDSAIVTGTGQAYEKPRIWG